MAIDFPTSPTNGQTFVVGTVTYTWDGVKWTAVAAGGGGGSGDKIEEGNTSAEVIDTGSDGRFVVTTEGSEALRVDSSQRVGIGTTNPPAGSTLAVNGQIWALAQQAVNFMNSDNSLGCSIQGLGGAGVNPAMVFSTSYSERARIDSGGRLLVGTSSASLGRAVIYKAGTGVGATEPQLTVQNNITDGSAADGPGINFANASGPVANIACGGDGNIFFSNRSSTSGSWGERMRITNAGHLLIGTTAALGVSENATQGIMLANDGTYLSARNNSGPNFFISKIGTGNDGDVLRFSRNGSQVGSISVSASATAYNTSSDYRLKENVTPVSDGITRLQQLKPSRFNFIADPDTVVDGFLAHEVQTIVPEAITGEKDAVDEDGNLEYQGIDQSKLVPLLTAALQEAIAKIETLEGMVAVNNITIDEQQHQLSTLAARLTALESA